jgi:hypothetical protein
VSRPALRAARRVVGAGSALLLLAAADTRPPPLPGDVAGLVAWYDAGELVARLRDGSTVGTWRDASGRGHDLVADESGNSAVLHDKRLNQKPVVHVGKLGSYKVTDPFDLLDHTIFLVYRAGYTQRALLCSDADPFAGIVLRAEGGLDQLRAGQAAHAYGTPSDARGAYTLTILARQAGRLRSFVNGVERSSGAQCEDVLRVGKFFHIALTTRVEVDGESLGIAEMAFYDRYLTDLERGDLSAHLAQKYGIRLEAEAPEERERPERARLQAWLSTATEVDLNGSAVPVPWTAPEKVEAPFRHDPKTASTKLHCTRDGTRVRLWVSLPLWSAEPGVALRILVLKNERQYHDEEVASGEFGGPERRATLVELATTLALDAGDSIEIIASRAGGEGRVTLEPSRAVLAALAL